MRHPLSVLLLSCAAGCAMAPPMINPPTPAKPMVDSTAPAPAYPATRRIDTVDTRFGTAVADPYRWLENDVRSDPEEADWVARQNRVTDDFLATLPLRDEFKARMTALYDYERFGVPQKAGGRYFYTHNDGLQNQSLLLVRDSVDGAGRVLIDPNGWSKDGATALAEWTPSEDGRLLAYAVQDGGTLDAPPFDLHPSRPLRGQEACHAQPQVRQQEQAGGTPECHRFESSWLTHPLQRPIHP